MIESLEARRLYARMVVAQSGGILSITGTGRDDQIEIGAGQKFITLSLDGAVKTVSTTGLKAIRISAGNGDDTIIVSPNVKIRASIEGGAGNDQIGGGGASDTLVGNAGNDSIAGHNGNDYFNGGLGDDVLYDITGVNVFHGGGGNDKATDEGYALGSGIEEWVQDGTPNPDFLGGATDLRTISGRLTLIRTGSLASTSESTTQTGPTAVNGGQYEVTQTYRDIGGGAIVGSYDDRWDLTDVESSGVIFTAYTSSVNGSVVSVPYLLPSR